MAVGVITVSNANNTGDTAEITKMLREEEKEVLSRLDVETFKEHPNIAAMQEVHRSFGNNPNKYPPSVQALVKRILKGGQLPDISPIVDIYNIISLRYVVCAGAEDTDKCVGDVLLTYADGSESFVPLGEIHEDPPAAGELVYKDDAGVICRKLNWREGDRAKITDGTKNCIVVVEGFPPMRGEELQQALDETAEMLREFCGAECEVGVL
jgi:lysyl-tRNA synthetase class 2